VISDRCIAGAFNARLSRVHNTVLVGGGHEPLYLPARRGAKAMIRYTRDYARSALHELAHWALAGPSRLDLEDYGLWYVPPPRTPAHQAAFFAAERRVQAVESLFCGACGLPFCVSADNFGSELDEFASRVAESAQSMRPHLAQRPRQILRLLQQLHE